eukprot:2177310-Prorocentrum_lima.AAC.1
MSRDGERVTFAPHRIVSRDPCSNSSFLPSDLPTVPPTRPHDRDSPPGDRTLPPPRATPQCG